MYEPLLRLRIPRHLAAGIDCQSRPAAVHARKLIIIGQAWPKPWAERNTALIASHVIQARRLGLVMSGDLSDRDAVPRPSVRLTEAERRQGIEAAEKGPLAPSLSVAEYLAAAFPDVAVVGVNDFTVLDDAQRARAERLAGLGVAWGTLPDLRVLGQVQAQLDALAASRLPLPLRRGLVLLQSVEQRFDRLPELLALAVEVGVPLDSFSALRQVARLMSAERGLPSAFARQQAWLIREVVQRLMGARVDDGGVPELFQVEIRRMLGEMVLGAEAKGIWQSDRPLAACADEACRGLIRAAAEAIEGNRDPGIACAASVLDLASVFGLNDFHYRQYRRLASAQLGWRSSARECLEELGSLAELLTDVLAGTSADRALVGAGRALRTIGRAVTEELPGREARRALRVGLSLAGLMEQLAALGGSFCDADLEEARRFDEGPLSAALSFYRSSLHQSRVIAAGVMEAMDLHRSEAAVLLCGGFHPGFVRERLEAGGQFGVSIVTPQLEERHPDDRDLDPEDLRSRAGFGDANISFHLLGRSLDEAVLGKKDAEGIFDRHLRPEPRRSIREWIEAHGAAVLLERETAALRAGPWHECRVCRRLGRAHGDARELVCSRSAAAPLLMRCPECDQQLVCLRCAGRREVAMLPGHGRREARRFGRIGGLAVCNRHDVPLQGDGSGRRWVAAGLPGHSWFA